MAAAVLSLVPVSASADGLKQVGDRYWIALASRQSADEAALPMGLGHQFLDHQRIHVDHAVLNEV